MGMSEICAFVWVWEEGGKEDGLFLIKASEAESVPVSYTHLIGITKITLGTSALENPNTYEISQEINRNGTGTVTKGSITLDISNLSGKKYIFVEVVTPNSGESGSSTVIANFRIRRIIAYK